MDTKVNSTESGSTVGEAELVTYTVDSFANGIAFGQQKLEPGMDARDYFSLRLKDDGELIRLRSRYLLHKNNPTHELERHLMRLSQQGLLSTATIYLGTTTDPFYPFDGKFDGSMKFLSLFERYTPGQLIIQTRSPLIVIALPVLKKLGRHASVTLGVETIDEEMARKYTPGLPRISDRLQAAMALRRFGVEVTLQVSPLLPYGDWRSDAPKFATTLIDHADYIYVKPLLDGSDQCERRVKASSIGRALAADRKFHWLRADSANPLITAIEVLCPEKLKLPSKPAHLQPRQISMFAA